MRLSIFCVRDDFYIFYIGFFLFSSVCHSQNVLNMVIAVNEGEMRFLPEEESEWQYAVVGIGFIEIINNRVTLLVESVERPEEIDIARAQEAKERALEKIRQKQSIQEYYHTQASLSRAMARLRVGHRQKHVLDILRMTDRRK